MAFGLEPIELGVTRKVFQEIDQTPNRCTDRKALQLVECRAKTENQTRIIRSRLLGDNVTALIDAMTQCFFSRAGASSNAAMKRNYEAGASSSPSFSQDLVVVHTLTSPSLLARRFDLRLLT